MAQFKIRARVLDLLGEEQIADCPTAISELFKKTNPSVVVIKVIEAESAGTGDPYEKVTFGSLGSGVLIDANGSILTAAHVIKLASDIDLPITNYGMLIAYINGIFDRVIKPFFKDERV